MTTEMQTIETNFSPADLRHLLPHEAISSIARQLDMSHAAVSKALQRGRPSHPAEAKAVRLIKAAGSQHVQHELNQLTK